MNDIIFALITNVFLVLLILMLTIHTWLPTIRPDWYFVYRIFESNMINYTDHKIFIPISGKKDTYDLNGLPYDKTGIVPTISNNGINTWYFEKGKIKAFIPQSAQNNIDGKLIKDTINQSIDSIVRGQKGLDDFLKTYGVLILGVVLVAMIGYMITKDQENTRLLLNATLSRG